jgi:hypothetical protein
MKHKTVPFESLLGLTICAVKKAFDKRGRAISLLISTDENRHFVMEHSQECCEDVYLYDVCGDLDDLIGSKILKAEESTNREDEFGARLADLGSFTWTFYHISAFGATVTLRWLGESNGYYSESVELREIYYQ